MLPLILAALTALAPQALPPGQQQPAAQQAAAETGEFKTAEELLDALEESGKDLQALVAPIKYDRTFEIQGDRQIRTGEVQFIGGEPDPKDPSRMQGRKFAIVFKQLWIGDERREQERRYIFDGEFLYERIPDERLMLVHRVAEPGERFDPLKIGEGPLPIPIGQRKADILARYEVQLVPTTESINPEDPDPLMQQQARDMLRVAAGASQLKLKPRPEHAADEEFTQIRLWYTRGKGGQLLPRMARTVNKSGDVSIVTLINPKVQMRGETRERPLISPEFFDTTVPEGWVVDRKDMRRAIEGE